MRLILTFVAAVLFVSPLAAHAQKVTVDYDKTVNFSSYKTYAWAEGMVARNPIVSQMIVAAVESELTARGLTKTDTNPDMRVAVLAATDMDLRGVGPSWNPNLNYGGNGNPSALVNITTGTLLIDLLDTKSDRDVWRGVAKDVLSHAPSGNAAADARRVEKQIKNGIRKMFQKYPTPVQKSP